MKNRSMSLPAVFCALFLAAGVSAKEGHKPDAWITTKAKSALATHKNVSAFGTHVETKNGIVILRGEVNTMAEKDLAASYVRDIQGVRGVDNQLVIKETTDRGGRYERKASGERVRDDGRGAGSKAIDNLGDGVLDMRVKSALAGHRSTSAFRTHVDSDNGAVTLTGTAKSGAERDLAEKVVREVKGVRSVENRIEVKR